MEENKLYEERNHCDGLNMHMKRDQNSEERNQCVAITNAKQDYLK